MSPLGGSTPLDCQERTGFLFSHPCENPASQNCARCGKDICVTHSHELDGIICCTTCARPTIRQAPSNRHWSRYSDDLFFRYGYDPYLSGGWRDPGDGNDFTAADGQSLRDEGNDGFEKDMAGS